MPTLEPWDPQEVLGLASACLPKHVAIIMDGNGRWARERGLPRILGHKNGSEAVRDTVTASARLGLKGLTLYSFSMENWKRPAEEVNALMDLYSEYLVSERRTLLDNNIRMIQIGRREGLPARVLEELDRSQAATAQCSGMVLALALNYGSRTEITDAVRQIARAVAAGKLTPDQIDEATISQHLYTAGLDDPDLLIRTSGQYRISNFLLWQISYAEIVVTPTLWPDFRKEHLFSAIQEYARRDRRFGGIKSGAER